MDKRTELQEIVDFLAEAHFKGLTKKFCRTYPNFPWVFDPTPLTAEDLENPSVHREPEDKG